MPEQVQIVMGAQRGLDLIAHMLLDPGDEAWMEDPGLHRRARRVDRGRRERGAGAGRCDGLVDRGDVRATRGSRTSTPSCQFPLGVR